MNAHTASLINAISLIIMGAWGHFGTLNPPNTAFIAVFVGVILMVLNNGIQYENKVISHIAVVLTLVILVILVEPFTDKLNAGDHMGVFRNGLMMTTSLFAMVMFMKSFRAARKARQARESN